jgi:hypothetical protein
VGDGSQPVVRSLPMTRSKGVVMVSPPSDPAAVGGSATTLKWCPGTTARIFRRSDPGRAAARAHLREDFVRNANSRYSTRPLPVQDGGRFNSQPLRQLSCGQAVILICPHDRDSGRGSRLAVPSPFSRFIFSQGMNNA